MFGYVALRKLIRFELTDYVEEFCEENHIPCTFGIADTVETGESYRLWKFYLPKICRDNLRSYINDEIRKIEREHLAKEEAGA